ncbi:hypothetical protein TTHERM_00633500 (macronuclear) [Tetrahymena thermophila SB210]|uniref:Uncharacterized protein n=1 Tax=Tetrahymena thermophila (strain SB210) TaxID=312017 RepID=Q22X03_TETTS|nr:hypothetical protein TTHERM_00633500 [Tetrahymena thermophila SB210]EAR89843.2 hypothetical protein TTHERM_00633500 [Tetrahymena thermophila SB210]|eukprot:XP_001010088.2 hypothetical protein TTHERM_00633500 [Tetrahymena thermophila SB210]
MQNFDNYLRNLDILKIKDLIQNEWDAIPETDFEQKQEIDKQDLISSFLDIIKLYLIQYEDDEENKSDSIVNFFMSYVYLKFQCIQKSSALAWKMIRELDKKSQRIQEFRLILFLFEQDNKKSLCSFYYRTRNIIIEYLKGYESDFLILDDLHVSVDQWSEITRRIFQSHKHEEVISKIAKVIACDQHEQHTFDPQFKLSCGRLIQICLWIYFRQVNQLLEDQKKYENQSALRNQQREENKIPQSFYQWGKSPLQLNNFKKNSKHIEAIKQYRFYKQKYPKQSTHKIYNASPPKVKEYMSFYFSDSKLNQTTQFYSPVKSSRQNQILHQSLSLQQSPYVGEFTSPNSQSEIPGLTKDQNIFNQNKHSEYQTFRKDSQHLSKSTKKHRQQLSPRKESFFQMLIFNKTQDNAGERKQQNAHDENKMKQYEEQETWQEYEQDQQEN